MLEQLTVPKTDRQLNKRHQKDLFDKRGLDPKWCEANCRSITTNQATELLGYTAQCDGIWLEGANYQGQFKPDKEWKSPQQPEKKAPKYRSPKGEYDAMLPIHPDDPRYWDDIEVLKQKCYQVDGHPCLVITEGFFKAIALTSHGIPTLALLGVEMGLTPTSGDPQGKRYLVPTLEKFARAGIGFIHAFDADANKNPNIIEAQRKLAHQLKKFNVVQYNVTGLWSEDQGKGIDDYIQLNGADKFKQEVLAKAVSIEDWEKQFTKEDDTKPKSIPPADVIGAQIAERYRGRLLWVDEFKSWMEHSLDTPGVWSAVSDTYIESAVYNIIRGMGISGFKTVNYVRNAMGIMRFELYTRHWGEDPNLLPFTDGVMNLKIGLFSDHSPSHRLTWCLPRPYNLPAVCQNWDIIGAWLTEFTQGNDRSRNILIHFAAAVLRGRSDLHKFLHLIGPGGNGKSVYTNLLMALVGEQNCWVGSLDSLEDKHEVIKLLGKRLALFPDQDKATGKMSNFKRLTGQDPLTGRKLHHDGVNFRFLGMAVVTSNPPIFQGMATWLKRRDLMISATFKPKKKRKLMKEFEPELSAFTRYLLTIPEEEITRVLSSEEEEMDSTLWQSAIRQDSIAAWLNEWVIFDESASTSIGCDRTEWEARAYNPHESTLFGSYSLYCRQSGLQAKGKNNFSADFLDLCQQVLGRENVVWERCKVTGRRCIRGVRLRTSADSLELTLDESLTTHQQSIDDSSDDLKPLPYIHPDDPDDLSNNSNSQIEEVVLMNDERDRLQEYSNSQIEEVALISDEQNQSNDLSQQKVVRVVNALENRVSQSDRPMSEKSSQRSSEIFIAPTNVESNTVSAPKQERTELAIAVGRYADYGGEKVEVVGWKDSGKQVWIELSSGKQILVKRGNLKPWVD